MGGLQRQLVHGLTVDGLVLHLDGLDRGGHFPILGQWGLARERSDEGGGFLTTGDKSESGCAAPRMRRVPSFCLTLLHGRQYVSR
jgi:hypothetical protein